MEANVNEVVATGTAVVKLTVVYMTAVLAVDLVVQMTTVHNRCGPAAAVFEDEACLPQLK